MRNGPGFFCGVFVPGFSHFVRLFCALSFARLLRHALLGILIAQAAFPPALFAGPNDPPASAPEAVTPANLPPPQDPAMAKLVAEVSAGQVTPADPNWNTGQRLRFTSGRSVLQRGWRILRGLGNQTFRVSMDISDSHVRRPVVTIDDFPNQVKVEYQAETRDLIFRNGDTEHVLERRDLLAPPMVDPEFVWVAAPGEGRNDPEVHWVQLRISPIDEFVGVTDNQADRLGFYSNINFYPVATFPLPLGVKVKALRILGPDFEPQRLKALLGAPLPKRARSGDPLVLVEDEATGNKTWLWIGRSAIYLSWEQRLKATLALLAQRVGTPSVLAAVGQVFEQDDARYQSAKAQIESSMALEAAESHPLDHALRSQFARTRGINLVTRVKALPVVDKEQGTRVGTTTPLERYAEKPRQEIDLEDLSPTGQWPVLHGIIQKQIAAGAEVNAGTATYAEAAVAAARKTESETQGKRWSAWKGLLKVKRAIMTPIRMMLLAGTLATVGAIASTSNDPYPFLTAVGSRIYDYADYTDLPAEAREIKSVGRDMTRAVISPVRSGANYLASQYYDSNFYLKDGGLHNFISWTSTIAMYCALIPLIYLAFWGAHRLAGDRVRFDWWSITRVVMTDTLTAFACINRSLQEGFWALAGQSNLFSSLHAGQDPVLHPNRYRAAFNLPLASDLTIERNAETLRLRQEQPEQAEYIASRAAALTLVARQSGLDLATLDMATHAPNMGEFIDHLRHNPALTRQWTETTMQLYNLLNGLGEKGLQASQLNPALTETLIVDYAKVANQLITAAEQGERDPRGRGALAFLGGLGKAGLSLFSKHVLHWLAFGLNGTRVFHRYFGRPVPEAAAKQTEYMMLSDHPLGLLILAANSPAEWQFPGSARVLSLSSEALATWHTYQPDSMANVAEAARTSPYAPLDTFRYSLPANQGGVAREQTIDEGLAAMCRGLVDPHGPSFFQKWFNMMRNVYNFFQAKLILSGVFYCLGFVMAGDVKQILDLPQYLAIPAAALFTAAWFWLIKYTVVISKNPDGSFVPQPNYATCWAGVYFQAALLNGELGNNRERFLNAIGLLSDSVPSNYQEGARQIKALFHEGRFPLPDEYNIPSVQYSEALAKQLIRWLDLPEHQPVPIRESNFLNLVFINIGLGAIGTTALADTLSLGLFRKDADPVWGATLALGWYIGNLAFAYGAYRVGKAVAPAFGPLHRGVTYTLDGVAYSRDQIKDACAAFLSREAPVFKPILLD